MKAWVLRLIAVFTFALSVNLAHAATVTIDGTDWDVSTVGGSFDNLQPLLESQTWWGDSARAGQFASAIALSLNTSGGGVGPGFAFAASSFGVNYQVYSSFIPGATTFGSATSTPLVFAVATDFSAVPVPASGLLLSADLRPHGVRGADDQRAPAGRFQVFAASSSATLSRRLRSSSMASSSWARCSASSLSCRPAISTHVRICASVPSCSYIKSHWRMSSS